MKHITIIAIALMCLPLQTWAIGALGGDVIPQLNSSTTIQSDVNFSYSKDGYLYESLKSSDSSEFERLRADHNKQPLDCVPDIGDVFANQIKRYESGNAWHSLMVRDEESKLQAALVFGRINSVYGSSAPDIQKMMQSYGLTDENNQRIENRGLATYVLMTDMTENAAHLAKWHKAAFEHCQNLATNTHELPIEKTQATHVMLLTRDLAPDANAMLEAGYTPYKDANGNSDLAEFYPPKITYAWVQAL